jgi:4'-phosphopantetheinyl transferase
MKFCLDEVHIWRVELDRNTSEIAALRTVLPSTDIERASRFRTSELSNRWIVARGALRSILAAYLGLKPMGLIFSEGAHGKPELVHARNSIFFNLTHTHNLAFVIVAPDRRVGVDAEWIRDNVEVEKLSRRFFAPEEADEILALPGEAQLAAFFSCWTRKEAFAKALGMGLTTPLNQYRVSIRTEEPARLISTKWHERSHWSLMDISESGVAAAAAIEGVEPTLRRFEFSLANEIELTSNNGRP